MLKEKELAKDVRRRSRDEFLESQYGKSGIHDDKREKRLMQKGTQQWLEEYDEEELKEETFFFWEEEADGE